MADSAQDRNLPASDKKKQKAREDGSLPRSRDLGHFLSLLIGGLALITGAGPLASWSRQLLEQALRFDRHTAVEPVRMGERFTELFLGALWIVLPLGLLMIAAGFLTALLAGGWNVSGKAVHPDFSRASPLAGVARLFSKQHLVDVAKMWIMAGVLGTVGAFYLRARWGALAGLLAEPLPSALAHLGLLLTDGFLLLLVVLGLWALIDVPLQNHLWLNRLKMSHEEVKQEHKEAEGSPQVKGRIKARMREMAKKRMLAVVPQADLVVMNPTHYAVALKYDEASGRAPMVVAKGTDALALKIREVAEDSRVPVLQSPPLARALYAHCELDREIPAVLFAAVAQVLAWVYRLRQDPAQRWTPPQVAVPADMDPHALGARPPSARDGRSAAAGPQAVA
ncbi:EscU/YscU/HrcU family type III secretion system export apparatus switch protein, partial [Ideonella livida]